ncbi:hypothetical protein [Phaeovulum sp.]|uniref:hypothetical protein n=1 Tax=Phaeovulum sp. TaxID=2934796 RepID=UPI003566CA02
MTVSENSNHISIETLAGHRAAVHWFPALLKAFPAPEDQRKIVEMIDAAMRQYESLVFYVHYTDIGTKEIVWHSEHDETTDDITVKVDLSERFTRDENGRIVLSEMEMAWLRWADELRAKKIPPYPDLETHTNAFYEWYAAQEKNQ